MVIFHSRIVNIGEKKSIEIKLEMNKIIKPSTKEKTLNELEYYLNKTYLDRFRIKTYPEQGSESINLVAEEQIKYIKE